MLNVTQNTINTLIMTLNDAITLANTGATGFTMNIINEYTKKEYNNIYLTDTSAYPNRYNKFALELTDEEHKNYSLAKIYLENNGYYKYNAYYYNSGATELLETGFMLVSGNTQIPTYDVSTDIYSGSTLLGEHAVSTSKQKVIWSGNMTAGMRISTGFPYQLFKSYGYFSYSDTQYGSISKPYTNLERIEWMSLTNPNVLKVVLNSGTCSIVSIDGTIYKGNFFDGVPMSNPFVKGQTYAIKIIK